MKNKIFKNKKKKMFKFFLINSIFIAYIFTLTIGYAFFSDSLSIIGNVHTNDIELNKCPFKMVSNDFFMNGFPEQRRYFFEYKDSLGTPEEKLWGSLNILDSYDSMNDVYNFVSTNNVIYPNDSQNTILGFDILTRPLYFIFENTSAYPIYALTFENDYENIQVENAF